MPELNVRDRVSVMKDGKERHGAVVEVHRDGGLAGLSQDQPKPLAVRVWLDGEVQPESEMRKPSEVW